MTGASLAVVIPVYNEGSGVADCLREVVAVLDSDPDGSPLIVVDDGSADETPVVLDKLAADADSLHVIHHDGNRGYGAALRTGALAARELGYEWVLFMDSDLTNPPSDVKRFSALLGGPVDYVKASRYVSTGQVVGVPWQRRAVSVVGNRVAQILSGLPIRDLTNGFRAIRTEMFLQMPLRERGFPIILEELYWARRMGLRLAELPTVLRSRADEQRASAFRYDPAVLWAYLRYALMMAGDRTRQRVQPRPFRPEGSEDQP